MNVSWYNKTDNIDKMNNLYIYLYIYIYIYIYTYIYIYIYIYINYYADAITAVLFL